MPNQSDRRLTDEEQKSRIHIMVRWALRDGVIVEQPCEVCGLTGMELLSNNVLRRRISAHHDDYNRPFSVRWLCRTHHRHWHDRNKAVPMSPQFQRRLNSGPTQAVYAEELGRYLSERKPAGPVAPRVHQLLVNYRVTTPTLALLSEDAEVRA